MVADREKIFETFGDKESVRRTVAFEKCVGSDGGAETHSVYVVSIEETSGNSPILFVGNGLPRGTFFPSTVSNTLLIPSVGASL